MTRTKTLHNALHAKGKTLFATCILALLATFALQAQTTRYVKETAAGTGDGTSWANASADLQAMINASAVDDEVHVAAGTYKPTKDPFGNASPGDTRDRTFYVKDGVKIYGGFSASAPEATLAARSITTNVTTLSGDFNSDDAIAGSGSTLDITNNGENAYHVVLSAAPSTGGIGITVDGFTIKSGNASTNGSFTLNGYTVYRSNAGGIYTHYGTNNLSNNTLLGNSAIYNGGAIYINFGTNTLNNNTIFSNKIRDNGAGIATNEGANTLSNNTLSGNKANNNGGGIYTNNGTNTLTNNTLSGNSANIKGGGIYTNVGTNTLTNNTLSENSALQGGGIYTNVGTNTLTNNTLSENSAIQGGGIYTNSGTNTLNNNTLSGNTASQFGGGIFTNYDTNAFINNIFWGNKIGTDATVQSADYYANGTNGNTFTNNLLQLASSSYPVSATGNYAIGVGASGNIFNQDPLFVDAAANNFQLSGCSPAINAGLNTLIVSGVERIPALDILGNGIYNTTKDMGAYERQSAKFLPSTATIAVTNNCGSSILNLSTNGTSFLWSNGATTEDITVSAARLYTVTVSGTTVCSVTASETTALMAIPIVNAGADVALSCASPSTTLIATGGVSYIWNNGATQDGSVSPSTTTTYTVTATAVNGCTATDNVLVTANSVTCLSAILSGTQMACANASVNLKAIVTNGTAPFTVVITNGTAPDITVNDYVSGANIAISSSSTNTYTLVSIKDAINVTGVVSGSAVVAVDNVAPFITPAVGVTVTESTFAALPTTVPTSDLNSVTTSFSDVKVAATPSSCYTYRYNITRTWTARDACGNTATKTQLIVSQGIILSCPANKTLNTNADGTSDYNCSTVVKASDNVSPIFLDNCNISILKYTLSGATTGNGNGSIAGLSFNKGITTVSYGVQVANTDACSFTVTINDNEAPKFGTINNTVVDACNIPNPIIMTAPSISDNCSGSAGITLTPSMDVTATVNGCASKAAAIKYIKSVTRTWVALDNAGNVSTAVQRMYIRDKQAPTAICKDIIVNIGSSNISVLASQINNGSSDNCTVTSALSLAICRNIGGVCNFASGISLTPSLIPTGSNFVNLPVTLRVTDACGNASNCTATIRLQKVGSLTNGNNTTDLSTTSDSKAEMEATPTTASTIDATHGSLKCFPNPFSDNLNLEYNLAKAVSKVTLKVYDNQGRLVTLSEQGEQLEGYYQINWNLSDLQGGMYHICLEIEGKCVKMERVIMLR